MASSTKDDEEPTFRSTAEEEGKAFDALTWNKGKEDGLFQACMKAIRSAHFRSNRVRALLVVAGLFTDKAVYREVLSIFYCVTKEVEVKLRLLLKEGDEISKKLLSLGYSFAGQYEQDLEYLYGTKDWMERTETAVQRNKAATDYREKVRSMKTGAEMAGAVFVLWGALIIGGGAAAMPRVKSRFGEEAVHLFQDVSGPGREKRKSDFVQIWDSLAESSSAEFAQIVRAAQDCMQCNNDVLSSLARNPWWLPYIIAALVGLTSVAATVIYRLWQKNVHQ